MRPSREQDGVIGLGRKDTPRLAEFDALQRRYGGWQDDPEDAIGADECVRVLLDDGLWWAACAEAVRADAERLRDWIAMPCWAVEVVEGASDASGPGTAGRRTLAVARLAALVASEPSDHSEPGEHGASDDDVLRAVAADWEAARLLPPACADAMVALQLRLLRAPVRRGRRSRIGVLFDSLTDGWTGVAGTLEMEVVPGGPPGLFPDPRVMPTFTADADFQQALTTAWERHRSRPCLVWRLRVDAPWNRHVVGGSLGAAFAVLLEEILGRPKRRHVRRGVRALSAWLRTPRGRQAITGALDRDGRLTPVGGLAAKLTVAAERGLVVIAPAAARTPGTDHDVIWVRDVKGARRALYRLNRLRGAVLAGAVAVVLALGCLGLYAGQREDNHRQLDLALSRRLAAQSVGIGDTDPALSSLLSAAAWRFGRTPEARHSMLSAVSRPGRAVLPIGSAMALAKDGHTIAVGGAHGSLRLWNLATRTPIGVPLTGHTGTVTDLALDPSGRILATASADDPYTMVRRGEKPPLDGTVRLWDLRTHRQLGAPLIGGEALVDVAFSPDGRLLATAEPHGLVRLWDVATRRPIARFRAGHGTVGGVAFSPDGRTLAAGGEDKVLRLWDVAKRRPAATLKPPGISGGKIQSLAFSPDGRWLATGGDGRFTLLWSVAARRLSGFYTTPGTVPALAFSPDGATLATAGGDGVTTLFEVASGIPGRPAARRTGVPFGGHSGGVSGVAFTPDGRTVVTAGADGSVRTWDAAMYHQAGPSLQLNGQARRGVPNPVGAVLSPDGRTLVVDDVDGRVRVLDAVTLRPRRTLPTGRVAVPYVRFSPDGQTLVTENLSGTIRFWNAATWRPIGAPIETRHAAAAALTFSPDGRVLASAGLFDGTVRLWNTATHAPLGGPLVSTPMSRWILAFTPDSATLLVGGGGSVRFFDVAGRRTAGPPLPDPARTLTTMAVAPDGRSLATGDTGGTIRMWDLSTRRAYGAPLAGHTKAVTTLAFGPDGLLASGARDGTVRLWDPATRRQIGGVVNDNTTVDTRLTGDLTAVEFRPGGKALFTTDFLGLVQQWDIARPADLKAAVCAIANRRLTSEEWKRYLHGREMSKVC